MLKRPMPKMWSLTISLGCLAALAAPPANAGTLIPVIPVKGSTLTGVYGINDNNVIVGFYQKSDGVSHGFFGTLDGKYTTFGYKDGLEARGINNSNYIVGYTDTKIGGMIGFERFPDGSIVTITYNGKPMKFYNFPHGINSDGVFVANGYVGKRFHFHSYYGKDGAYLKELSISLGDEPHPRGINDSKTVVGYFLDGNDNDHGFLLQNGVASEIDYPDAKATDTLLEGINNKGMAVGMWTTDLSQGHYREHAFAFDTASSAFIPIDVPDSRVTYAFGLNNAGVVAITADQGSFIYCMKKKTCPKGGVEIPDGKPIHVAAGRLLNYGDAPREKTEPKSRPAVRRFNPYYPFQP